MNKTSHQPETNKTIRYTLGSLLLFMTINAFGGGFYGMTGAKDIPVAWLKDSPFQSYFIPSLLLFVVVGGSALMAAIAVFKLHFLARTTGFVAGAIVMIWVVVQVSIIGYVSWLQPAIFMVAALILILTSLLPKHEH